jgi:hypothetical protein
VRLTFDEGGATGVESLSSEELMAICDEARRVFFPEEDVDALLPAGAASAVDVQRRLECALSGIQDPVLPRQSPPPSRRMPSAVS